MKTRKAWRGVVRATLIGLALWCAGCGPKVDFLRHEADLDYPSLKQGGITPLCAVTSEGDEELRDPLGLSFEAALREERRDLRVLRVSELRRVVGEEVEEDLVERFERSGRLRESDLAQLDSLMGSRARYIALARVEDESVDHEETEETDSETGVTTTTRSGVLRVRVAFSVYDLQIGRRVWSAEVTGSDRNSKSETDEPKGFLASLISSILGSKGDYPEAPEANETLRKVFTRFAKELPAAD